ncbi:MAG: 50S ribosomal protein L22 [Eubacteriales bacterium]|jgi:large subunit ribosomal protein L22|nr:50S ribosomal protein L22 [Eubacteriales bacterium]MDD3109290.1 50S ribosomal protein L22 [Eubacteriales bacterium]MDD4134336.1 50S ribosomal protein L22 [Eubacteriales bacterium]NLO13139.1 50S ribosomal protein L22 [Clostridiales bacterium]
MATNTRTKGQRHDETREKRPHAHARHIRVSSRKAKLVVDLVRGKDVSEALAILAFTPNAAAPVLHKLISSAQANAVNNLEMDPGSLYVAEIYANPGPTLKRFRPRARGSASTILKRTSHFSVVLDQR